MLHHMTKTVGSFGHDKRSHQKKTGLTKVKGTLLFKWLAAVCVLECVGATTSPSTSLAPKSGAATIDHGGSGSSGSSAPPPCACMGELEAMEKRHAAEAAASAVELEAVKLQLEAIEELHAADIEGLRQFVGMVPPPPPPPMGVQVDVAVLTEKRLPATPATNPRHPATSAVQGESFHLPGVLKLNSRQSSPPFELLGSPALQLVYDGAGGGGEAHDEHQHNRLATGFDAPQSKSAALVAPLLPMQCIFPPW